MTIQSVVESAMKKTALLLLVIAILSACQPAQTPEVSGTGESPFIPGAPAAQTAQDAEILNARGLSSAQTLLDRAQTADFYADTVYWYDLENKMRVRESEGADSPFAVIAGFEISNPADGTSVRRALVSASLTDFAMATEISPDKWVVETPLYPGVLVNMEGAEGQWELRGYFGTDGQPIAGDAYRVDRDGNYTGEVMFCNYRQLACTPVETVGANGDSGQGDYAAALLPGFGAKQQQLLDTLNALGVDYSGWNYSEKTETGEFGVYLDKNAMLTLDGAVKLTLPDGSVVSLPKNAIHYEDGAFAFDGYELDESGAWVEAESEAMQTATALVEQYGLDPESVTITEEGGAVSVTDNETGKVLIRTLGYQSMFELGFAVDTIAKNSCDPTDFKPNSTGLMLAESVPAASEYMMKLLVDADYQLVSGLKVYHVLIDRENKCWGFVIKNNFFYRDHDKVAHKLSLIALTADEIQAFRSDR